MAEPEYPIAWGVWFDWPANPAGGFFGPRLWESREGAENSAKENGCTVVKLIPRPVHERLVAEAVAAERAAERERCAKIIDKAYCANTDEAMRWSRVAKRIREVPQ